MATKRPKEVSKTKEKATAKPSKSSARPKAYAASNADEDDDTPSNAVPKKREKVEDDVTTLLSGAKDNVSALKLAKKYEHFQHVNKESLQNLVKLQDDLGAGMFRMRLVNILRGARSAAARASEKTAKGKAPAAKTSAKPRTKASANLEPDEE